MASREVLQRAADGFNPWEYMLRKNEVTTARRALVDGHPIVVVNSREGVGQLIMCRLTRDDTGSLVCRDCPVAILNYSSAAQGLQSRTGVACDTLVLQVKTTESAGVTARLVSILYDPDNEAGLDKAGAQSNCHFKRE